MGGMRTGSKHHWRYKDIGTRDNGRSFTRFQVKRRSKSAPRGSGMPIGSKLHWNLNAIERWTRIPKGYKVVQTGTKYQYGFTTKPKQTYIRSRYYKRKKR